VYVVQVCCTLDGSLNVSALERAWQQVMERHPVLRTSFHWQRRKEPFQVVHRQVKLPFEQQDWRETSPAQQQQRLKDFLQADCQRGFDLDKPPLMRVTLIQLADDSYQFVWTKHHLILDGWSTGLVLKEAFEIYQALHQGTDLPLTRSRPYGDYITWLQQQDLSQAEAFWRQRLQGFTTPTPLSVDRKLGSTSSEEERHAQQKIQLSQATTSALKSLAQQHQLTLNTLVQGAFALLLSRYSREEDVLFGATSSGRPADLAGAEDMVGLFINTLPVRVHVAPEELLIPWLKKLQAGATEARQYEYSPLAEVQAWSDVPRNLPLFESILVFENYPVDPSLPQQGENLGIRDVSFAASTNYPLTVVVGGRSKLSIEMEYSCQRFDAATITRMLGHLQTLLEGMVANPNQHLKDLQVLTEAERYQLLVEWNDTQADYSETACIHELFEAQVEQTPDAIAVVFKDQQLTYRELNARANQLARYLRTLGVRPEVLVGICVERSSSGAASLTLDMIVGLLGILKAGGAYLPIDPTYPQERIAFMMSDSRVPILLTQETLVAGLPELETQVVCIDKDWALIAQEREENLVNHAVAENLAYVIYTSGSTGKPKGVLIEHKSLVNYTETAIVGYALSQSDRILQFASISFDAAAEEIFPCLVRGATLVLRTDEMLSSMPTFLKTCRDWQITVLDLPTAWWHQMVSEAIGNWGNALPESLRLVIIGGEKASLERLVTWQQQVNGKVRLVNSYGPTEATIVTTTCDLSGDAAVDASGRELAIGRPISNAQIYILNPYLQPTPVGVPGELYIGGVGVARGYLNQPELTAERFIPNLFNNSKFKIQKIQNPKSKIQNPKSGRLYKTGDLARYRTDGNIEFLGRLDNQVKIRGFRIELGEIEAVLSQHPVVREAIVLAREDVQGNKRLVAYVVASQLNPKSKIQNPKSNDLRRFLSEQLPDYMIPSAFVMLETIPLTPNGKVDRRSLPAPEQTWSDQEATYTASRTPVEESLAQIWAEVLGRDRIGIYDNFFDLGGHSLLVTQLVVRVRERFEIELPLRSLFEMPTVAELAQSIELARQTGGSIINAKAVVDLKNEAVLDPAIRPEYSSADLTPPTPLPYKGRGEQYTPLHPSRSPLQGERTEDETFYSRDGLGERPLLQYCVEDKTEPGSIFLTGTTGFIGAFLLNELLQQTQANIYCLVRSANADEGKRRIRSSLESYLLWDESKSPRIIPVVGDLSQPLLGLSEDEFRATASQIDAIYHNGAWVHHAYPYSTLKATNVLGTQEVLRLASQIKVKAVHFISTTSVFSSLEPFGVKIVQETDNPDDYPMPTSGYAQSKRVAEKLVTIARDRGIPTCIYRLGRVSGHSKTGVFNINDRFYRLIVGCIQIGSVPDEDAIEDMTPVDYVSRAIVHLSRQKSSLGKAFHFINPQPFRSKMLLELLRSLGYPIASVPYAVWRTKLLQIAESSPEHILSPLLPFFPERSSQKQVSNSAAIEFDCQNTIEGLAGSSITCPPINEQLLHNYVSYLIRSEIIEAPQLKIGARD
jgi:amino acid adenylation domain-containing protein/thioester reductase-like protein